MKAYKSRTAAIIAAAALIISTSSCTQPAGGAQTGTSAADTAAAQTTASEDTTAPQTTETAVSTEEQSSAAALKYGLWWAKSDEGYQCYYTFNEDGSGSLLYQDLGIGVGLNYSSDGSRYTFEMGGEGAFSYADMTFESDTECTLKWEDGRTEHLTFCTDAPDSFRFYASYDLAEMAKTYYKDKHNGTELSDAVPSFMPDDRIKLELYVQEDGGQTVADTYIIDRFTAAGEDSAGEPVNLEPYGRTYGEGNAYETAPAEDLSGSFALQWKTLKEEGALFGVRYLGYIDPEHNDPETSALYIINILEHTGASKDCNIFIDMPYENFASTQDGTELYLIIPTDPNGTVTVKEFFPLAEDNTASEGRTLYSYQSLPFLLKCNVSEIMPDVIIYITDSNGKTVTWSPGISGEDGHVLTYHPDGTIHDFTDYSRLAGPELAPVG